MRHHPTIPCLLLSIVHVSLFTPSSVPSLHPPIQACLPALPGSIITAGGSRPGVRGLVGEGGEGRVGVDGPGSGPLGGDTG
jgi:hypothetical protein